MFLFSLYAYVFAYYNILRQFIWIKEIKIKELAKKPLYTINDAAQVLCIPTEQIVDLVETGIIPAFGSAQLIRSADIIQFICPPDLQTLSYPTHQLVDILDEMLLVKKGGTEGSTMEEYINTSKRIRVAIIS